MRPPLAAWRRSVGRVSRSQCILGQPQRETQGQAVIHIIRSRANEQQITGMLQTLERYIKLAVDIRRGILAGGGAMHADCEAVLLEDGSQQEYVWGADWDPTAQQVAFESLINIRPRQDNPSMEIIDSAIRQRVAEIAHQLLGGA